MNFDALILAAGQGTRLRPLTDKVPKCLIKFNGKALLNYQIDVFKKLNVGKILVVTGYKECKIPSIGIKKIWNKDFKTTNMVRSMFKAIEFFPSDKDLVISYGDIIYQKNNLKKLLKDESGISIMVDKNWEQFWSLRFEDPLVDAETLRIDKNGLIKELGKKSKSLAQIQGQYTGLIKISKDYLQDVIQFYLHLENHFNHNQNILDQMYMTEFLQLMIDNGTEIKSVEVNNGWLEFDTVEDLELYSAMLRENKLDSFFNLDYSL